MNKTPKDKKPMSPGLFFVVSFLCMAIPLVLIFWGARQALPPLGPPAGNVAPADVDSFASGLGIVAASFAVAGIAVTAGTLTVVRGLINKASTLKSKDE
jgi:hypothetical protein